MWTKQRRNEFIERWKRDLKKEEVTLKEQKLCLALATYYADIWRGCDRTWTSEQKRILELCISDLVRIDWSEDATITFHDDMRQIIATDKDGKCMDLVSGSLIEVQ